MLPLVKKKVSLFSIIKDNDNPIFYLKGGGF